MPLLSFPPEVLELIIQDLMKPDLLALRLSCKYLLNVIANRPFQTIVVEGNHESFNRLKALSESIQHSKHVKRLIYSGSFLGGDLSVDPCCLRNLAGENQWQIKKSIQVEKSQESYHYRRYHQILQSQQMMQMGRVDVTRLTYSMKRFPNLREIEFCSGHYRSREAGGELASSAAFAPKSWSHVGLVARETLVHPDPVTGEPFHAKQFKALLTATKCSPQIDIIRAFGVPLAAFRDSLPPQMPSNLQNCHHLMLQVGFAKADRSLYPLKLFLQTAQRLKTLQLAFEYRYYKRFPLELIFDASFRWRDLTTLSLVRFTASRDNLCALLRSQATTLRTLQLQHIWFRINTRWHTVRAQWVSFILFLRSHLQLKSVRLRGQLNGPIGWHVHGPWDRCPKCPESQKPEDTLTYRIERYITSRWSAAAASEELGQASLDAIAQGHLTDCSWQIEPEPEKKA
ncbi:MAG: hypothetical protein Q9217_006497 [Psora testacea]